MAVRNGNATTGNLVDLSQGTISREVFVNHSVYQQEQEQVFARSWLFVGHESQVPSPGDYFVSSMGEESVILCRDRQGQIHVFLNTCMHRGMKVCRYDEGNTAVFTCPYHGWSYATDGQLVGVPYFKEAYREELDKSRWGLIEVAQLANYKGTIWANWDASAPGFIDYLGDMKTYLDTALDSRDGSEGGSEVLVGIQKWVIPSNWKSPPRISPATPITISATAPWTWWASAQRPQPSRTPTSADSSYRVATTIPEGGHGALSYWQDVDGAYSPQLPEPPNSRGIFPPLL